MIVDFAGSASPHRAADKALESLGILAALRTASSDETSAGETLLALRHPPVHLRSFTDSIFLCPIQICSRGNAGEWAARLDPHHLPPRGPARRRAAAMPLMQRSARPRPRHLPPRMPRAPDQLPSATTAARTLLVPMSSPRNLPRRAGIPIPPGKRRRRTPALPSRRWTLPERGERLSLTSCRWQRGVVSLSGNRARTRAARSLRLQTRVPLAAAAAVVVGRPLRETKRARRGSWQ